MKKNFYFLDHDLIVDLQALKKHQKLSVSEAIRTAIQKVDEKSLMASEGVTMTLDEESAEKLNRIAEDFFRGNKAAALNAIVRQFLARK